MNPSAQLPPDDYVTACNNFRAGINIADDRDITGVANGTATAQRMIDQDTRRADFPWIDLDGFHLFEFGNERRFQSEVAGGAIGGGAVADGAGPGDQ